MEGQKMNQIDSLVIVRWPKGYVAHLRFEDPINDCDVSAASQYMLDKLIHREIEKAMGRPQYRDLMRKFNNKWARYAR
jgi:hypothetical protein